MHVHDKPWRKGESESALQVGWIVVFFGSVLFSVSLDIFVSLGTNGLI
jgi:hypothetical protein